MGCTQSKANTVVESSKPASAPAATTASRAESGARPEVQSQSSRKEGWFQSSAGLHPEAVYVFKTTFFQPDGSQEKVFVNVYHHKKVPSEHCLVQNKTVVVDKRGENCFAYGIVIADDLRDKCLEEKYREWVSERVVELLNQLYKDARLDGKGVKLPIIKKGFVGDSVPYFSLESDLVSWQALSFIKAAEGASTKAPPAAPASTSAAAAVSANPVAGAGQGAATTTSAGSGSGVAAVNGASAKATESRSQSPVQKDAAAHPPAASTAAAPATTTSSSTATTGSAASVSTKDASAAQDAAVAAAGSGADEKQVAAQIADIVAPRRLTGWMKKQGHVAKNWKTRFFVLDHGFLTYYVDQQEKPPFGVDKKGQVCLAGYREKSVMKRPDSVAFLSPGYDRNARRSVTVASSALVATAESGAAPRPHDEDDDDNEYDENDENACLIQLEFYAQIIDANALDELKRRNGDATFKHDVHKEFLLVCRTQQERDGWLAALEAHTSYIENVALKYIQERDAALAKGDSSPTAPAAGESGRRFSFTSSTSQRRSITAQGQRNVSRASRHASMALSAQKWSVFLNKNEKVVLMGIVEKPNPVGYRYLRELLLVQRQDADDDAGKADGAVVCRKRLIYIDSNSYEKKGEVLWLDSAGKFPSVKVVRVLVSCRAAAAVTATDVC